MSCDVKGVLSPLGGICKLANELVLSPGGTLTMFPNADEFSNIGYFGGGSGSYQGNQNYNSEALQQQQLDHGTFCEFLTKLF
jgi:hypothetical protein